MPETNNQQASMTGRCSCGAVRYRVNISPLYVHCCHCTDCQRQTGSAFAVNVLVETSEVKLLSGETECINVPTPSGIGQQIIRCKSCKVAVWSHYNMGGLGKLISFVRAGTLDQPHSIEPDIHIYTTTKCPWVRLPSGAKAVDQFYPIEEFWSAESVERWKTLSN